MTIRSFLFLSLAAYLAYQFAKKAKLAFRLEHTDTRFKLQGTKMLVYIQLTNKSDQSAVVENITGNVTYNGAEVAKVEYRYPVTIVPNSVTEIELIVTPTINGLLQLIDKILDKTYTNFYFTGIIKVDGVPIPVKKELSYE
jgi:LEA14-like dessication related protein